MTLEEIIFAYCESMEGISSIGRGTNLHDGSFSDELCSLLHIEPYEVESY